MKKFTWTVQITVDESWVADGFDLTDERAHEMVCRELPYAYGHEIKAKVMKGPALHDIMEVQGYTEAEVKHAKEFATK